MELAAVKFYSLLMSDVEQLCADPPQARRHHVVEPNMLCLAFRLSQLDKDWAKFIPLRYMCMIICWQTHSQRCCVMFHFMSCHVEYSQPKGCNLSLNRNAFGILYMYSFALLSVFEKLNCHRDFTLENVNVFVVYH